MNFGGLKFAFSRQTSPLLLLFIGFLALLEPIASAKGRGDLTIDFAEGVDAPVAQDLQLISAFAQNPAISGATVVIHDRRFGLLADSLDAVRVETRSLRVFEILVEHGVAPRRIRIESTADKPKSNSVTLELVPREEPVAQGKSSASQAWDDSTTDYRLYFEKRSAIPQADEAGLQRLIATLRQPLVESIAIEGYTDSDGDDAYNQTLSSLRALSIYRDLVRSGIDPRKLIASGRGVAKQIQAGTEGRNAQAERRQVLISWSKKAPAPAPELAFTTPAPLAPVITEREPARNYRFETSPFFGALVPLGDLARHTKTAAIYGISIGATFNTGDRDALRVEASTTSIAKLLPKESDRSGTLNLRFYSLTCDYLFARGSFSPFVGFGLNRYLWSATIAQPSTQRFNTGGKLDNGVQLRAGLAYRLFESASTGPEISYHKASGDLNESLLAPFWVFSLEI